MPHIDLTIPIAILCAAFINVLLVRAYAAWGNRRMKERTEALLRDIGDEDDNLEAASTADVKAPESE